MGIFVSKCHTKPLIEPGELRSRISFLEAEKEHREEPFSIEKRRQVEEMAGLRRKVEEEEEKAKRLKEVAIGGCRCHGWRLEKDYFEQVKKEQVRREEAVEKWKQLYLAIKMELDELIRRTRGDRYYPAEGFVAQGLLRELKAKDEALEALRAKLAAVEKEGTRREREIDILRQSLRILTNSVETRGRRFMKKKHSHLITVQKNL